MSEGSSNGSDGPDGPGEEVEEGTKVEELLEASAAHVADRPPTAAEEAAAEGNALGPEVSEHEREMGKLGAEVKGEGEID
ncbi:MAG TPA: hypothetical protein VHX67_00225 [Acidimicrobiales bacterium]|jgi:hypothetical protein|nr:hypothetical protein [Acidimicrobiales bacterium]